MNNERHPHMIHSDPPSVDSPILSSITYNLSNAIYELRGQDNHLEILLAFAISELQIVNSQMIYYGEDSIERVIECLKEVSSVFEKIGLSNLLSDLKDSISLLESILIDSENLYHSPSNNEDEMCVGSARNLDYMMRYQKRIVGVRAKCPSCGHEFLASSFNVSRNPYGYKCPNCNQSISY